MVYRRVVPSLSGSSRRTMHMKNVLDVYPGIKAINVTFCHTTEPPVGQPHTLFHPLIPGGSWHCVWANPITGQTATNFTRSSCPKGHSPGGAGQVPACIPQESPCPFLRPPSFRECHERDPSIPRHEVAPPLPGPFLAPDEEADGLGFTFGIRHLRL